MHGREGEPLLDGAQDFIRTKVQETRRSPVTAPLIVARTVAVFRDVDIFARPRPVACWIRWTEERNDGCSDCGRDVQRTGIAGDHQSRRAREREQIADAGLWRGNSTPI